MQDGGDPLPRPQHVASGVTVARGRERTENARLLLNSSAQQGRRDMLAPMAGAVIQLRPNHVETCDRRGHTPMLSPCPAPLRSAN